MIKRLLFILNETVTAMPVGTRHPFAEVVDGAPVVHASTGQYTPIVTDATGGVSYWRADGTQSIERLNSTGSCGNAARVSIPIALVAFVRREECDDMDSILHEAASQVLAARKTIRNGMSGAFSVSVDSFRLGIDLVKTGEVAGFNVPASLAVLALACTIGIDMDMSCIDTCDEPDLLCMLMTKASNKKVEDCLGAGRVAEICDGGGPCDPLGYDLHNSEDTVLLSGVVTDPCGQTLELTAPDATYDLKDAGGNTLSSGSIPSQVNAVVTAPSATVLRDGSPYGTVLSGGSIDVDSDCQTPDSTIQLKDSDGVDIGFPIEVPYNSTNFPVTAPSGTVYATDGTTEVLTVKSNGEESLPQSVIKYKDSANASQVTAASDTEFASGSLRPATEVPRRELFYVGGTGTGLYVTASRLIADTVPQIPLTKDLFINLKFKATEDTITFTVDADTAGTLTAMTSTAGTNGTLTIKINAGSFGAFTNPTTLVATDVVSVKRTTYSASGTIALTGTYT